MDHDTNGSRKLVLGLGNLIFQDEGLGIQALQSLQAQYGAWARPDLEFLDGGVLGLNLLPMVEESSHLLVLDVVNANQRPGTVIEMTRDEIPIFAGVKLSEHQLTFQEVLGLAHVRQRLPKHLHLIGLQPQTLGVGLELTPVVAQSLPVLVRRAAEVLVLWGLMEVPPQA
jgi:hydrogenase maturation protease